MLKKVSIAFLVVIIVFDSSASERERPRPSVPLGKFLAGEL